MLLSDMAASWHEEDDAADGDCNEDELSETLRVSSQVVLSLSCSLVGVDWDLRGLMGIESKTYAPFECERFE